MESRRAFLAGLFWQALSGLAGNAVHATVPFPHHPTNPSSGKSSQTRSPPAPLGQEDPGKNEKDMKKKVEHLYQLAEELKDEVEKTDTSKVFSLNLMKKTEEIEKLAHDIKNRSKG